MCWIGEGFIERRSMDHLLEAMHDTPPCSIGRLKRKERFLRTLGTVYEGVEVFEDDD